MAKTIDFKIKQFKKTINSLKASLDKEKNDIIRDSVIKRFEYTYEICWKTVKEFLKEKFGVDVFSPKECFRELRKNKLLTDKETEMFLRMIDDRNLIIHTYDENFSNELYKEIIVNYYKLFKKIIKLF